MNLNPENASLVNSNSENNSEEKLKYSYREIEPLAMTDLNIITVLMKEFPSLEWLGSVLFHLLIVLFNNHKYNEGQKEAEDKVQIEEILLKIQEKTEEITGERSTKIALPKGIGEISDFLKLAQYNKSSKYLMEFASKVFQHLQEEMALQEQDSCEKIYSIEEYNKLFTSILKLPAIANNFQEDETFAYMRVAGPNPVMIERVENINKYPNFPVTDDHYKLVMGNDDSLEAACNEGRVYIADYAILAGAINGTFPECQKYLYAPLALFAVPKGDGKDRMLKPVAIQCQQEPGPDNPILTPKGNPDSWMFAKTVVQIADGNFHEAVTHLARTHLFVEPFVIATQRKLPDEHPLSLLLRPHFEGTLLINFGAQRVLVAPKQDVNRLLAATIDESRVFAVKGLQTYPFNQQMLRDQLKRRGVYHSTTLPVYPYRDDALLIWDAIYQWVSSYLNIYYESDEQVEQDGELQAWAADLIDFNGGRVTDFGDDGNGPIKTLDYLIKATTLIIFTASAQHAAVNFPQKDIMSYAPAMPLAGYTPASSVKSATKKDFLKLLPSLSQAQQQLTLTYLLGSTYYTKLGQYKDGHFDNDNDDVQDALDDFQQELRQIKRKIKKRNNELKDVLPYAYKYLLPRKIPQSINI